MVDNRASRQPDIKINFQSPSYPVLSRYKQVVRHAVFSRMPVEVSLICPCDNVMALIEL